jgi:hypothetical protein
VAAKKSKAILGCINKRVVHRKRRETLSTHLTSTQTGALLGRTYKNNGASERPHGLRNRLIKWRWKIKNIVRLKKI